MKKTQSLLMLALSVTSLFFIACKSHEKTAGVQATNEIPVTSKSKDAIAAFQEGLAYADQNNGNKAREAFTRAINLDPGLAIAYMYRSSYDLSIKEGIDDLAKAKQLLEGASDWEKMYYDYQNSFVTNDYNKRLEIAKKIVAAYPGAARAQVDLGFAYLSGNDVNNAKMAYQKAIELDPKCIGGYNGLVYMYINYEPKDFKMAEMNAIKVVELSPKSSDAQISLGDCYRAQDDLEKARAAYMKAIELNPDESAAYYKKGHINSFLGKYEQARKDYAEGANHEPDKSGANMWTALTYLYAGDAKAAMQAFRDLIAKADASGDSKSKIAFDKLNYLTNCATICLHTGNAAGLKETVTMMQGPSDQVASDIGSKEEKLIQKANLLYWWSLTSAMEGKLDDAKAKAEEIISMLAPVNNPTKLQDYEMALGYISMKEKKFTDAISHFEKANLNSVYTQYWLAMAHEAAGNKDKAMEILKKLSVYNFNGVDYAVIRNEIKKKLAM